eukprot:CAMPEP_0198351800 /NCGR_PEP_ID=MMETSP1450-20131203/104329_1 /TAXON_ID=753684 ORGANISM="Madagascaria erythrocladiodes, Strain CCMP3234" /NCGR_SAMPLE_ID=MMETSP1450 /ASSEMBLY_ACC=CAM_ASM_001115 /LENGTH=54 /DNA_ID=CAMNT_0044057755 /DNA_START=96 /DNA_END=257 /DNA_ORIENTATION=+
MVVPPRAQTVRANAFVPQRYDVAVERGEVHAIARNTTQGIRTPTIQRSSHRWHH